MQGMGGGQTRTYNSTVSLTNNNHYYVITIREQRQCTEISQLIVKTIIIIKQNIFLKCVVEESFLHKAGHLHFPGTELKSSFNDGRDFRSFRWSCDTHLTLEKVWQQ